MRTAVPLDETLIALYNEQVKGVIFMRLLIQEQIFPLESPPTPQCHASTVVKYEGSLYAAWFGGTKEGHDDVGIWLSQRTDGAWAAPECMASGDVPHWNPVLFA